MTSSDSWASNADWAHVINEAQNGCSFSKCLIELRGLPQPQPAQKATKLGKPEMRALICDLKKDVIPGKAYPLDMMRFLLHELAAGLSADDYKKAPGERITWFDKLVYDTLEEKWPDNDCPFNRVLLDSHTPMYCLKPS